MSKIFEVTPEHISRLNSLQLTALLRRLLNLEAERHGLPTSGVEVPLKITVSDAGEDGRIEWSDGPVRTNWAPCRLTLFQIKATAMSPQQCANELTEKKDKVKASKVKGGKASKPKPERLKANILDAFKKKGAYIFFCGREYNKKAQRRENKESSLGGTINTTEDVQAPDRFL